MLTLGRESGQYVVIGGDIIVQVVEVGNQLRLAIDAPRHLTIERGENYEKTHPVPAAIRRLRQKQDGAKYGFTRAPGQAPGDAEEI